MGKEEQREKKEREMLAYLGFKHPADRTVEEQAEFERLRQKYGRI